MKKRNDRTKRGLGRIQLCEAWPAISRLERKQYGPSYIYAALRETGQITLSYSWFFHLYRTKDALADLRAEAARRREKAAQKREAAQPQNLYQKRRAAFAAAQAKPAPAPKNQPHTQPSNE